MREAALLSTLLLASATTTTLASAAGRIECLRTRSRELAAAASCGDEASLTDCFSDLTATAESDLLASALESCFVDAGCAAAESQIEALYILEQCDRQQADLRRRHHRRHDGP
ncbi:hypothetical protein VTH06DRAFT_2508, partial [Thermothelomyces fergusii]